MFILNGKPLSPDTAFTAGDIQYPSNWLRLASVEEREAIGITEEADPVRSDDRFYWNGDITNPKALEDKLEFKEDGSPLFVQVYDEASKSMVDTTEQLVTKGLKSQFIAASKDTAGKLLAATDWTVIRKMEREVAIPASVAEFRAAVVAASGSIEVAIKATTTTAELADLAMEWPV